MIIVSAKFHHFSDDDRDGTQKNISGHAKSQLVMHLEVIVLPSFSCMVHLS